MNNLQIVTLYTCGGIAVIAKAEFIVERQVISYAKSKICFQQNPVIRGTLQSWLKIAGCGSCDAFIQRQATGDVIR